MARRGAALGDGRVGGRRSRVWLQGLLCGAVATLATPTALLVGVLFLPALIASVLDCQPGKPVARSMALFSLCGTVGPVLRLWAAGHTLEAAATLAADLDNLLLAWGAAAAGWLLAELAPVAVLVVLEALARSQTARLRAERTRQEAEWGFSPAAQDARALD
jgi:hypothetical protein